MVNKILKTGTPLPLGIELPTPNAHVSGGIREVGKVTTSKKLGQFIGKWGWQWGPGVGCFALWKQKRGVVNIGCPRI
jgi:hypothetical protein